MSVITATLNSVETVKRTLGSVVDQKVEGLEYIVVDGGSSDGTLEILDSYGTKITHLASEADDGVSDAFNKGIGLAKGEYIGILNSDDFYETDILSKILVFAAENNHPDVIYGSIRFLSRELEYLEQPDISRIWDYMSIFHPSMFIRSSAYRENGGYSLSYRYAMDCEWVHRALAKGLRFVEYPGVVATMRLGGLSHRNLGASLAEFRRSSITNRGQALRAWYFFSRQYLLQTGLKSRWLKLLNLSRRNLPYA